MSYSEIMMAVNSDIKKPLNRLIEELSDEEIALLESISSKLGDTKDVFLSPIEIKAFDSKDKKTEDNKNAPVGDQYRNELWYCSYYTYTNAKSFRFGYFDMKTGNNILIDNWYEDTSESVASLYSNAEFLFATSEYSYGYCQKRATLDKDFKHYIIKYNKKTGTKEYIEISATLFYDLVFYECNKYLVHNDEVYLIHKPNTTYSTLDEGLYKITNNNSGLFSYEKISSTIPSNFRGREQGCKGQLELDGFVAFLSYDTNSTYSLYLFDVSQHTFSKISSISGKGNYQNIYGSLFPICYENRIIGIFFNHILYIFKNNTLVQIDSNLSFEKAFTGDYCYYFFYAENGETYFSSCYYQNYSATFYKYNDVENLRIAESGSILFKEVTKDSTSQYYFLPKGIGFYTTQENIRHYIDFKDAITIDSNGNYVSRLKGDYIIPDEDGYITIPETGIYLIDTIYGSPRGTFIKKGE